MAGKPRLLIQVGGGPSLTWRAAPHGWTNGWTDGRGGGSCWGLGGEMKVSDVNDDVMWPRPLIQPSQSKVIKTFTRRVHTNNYTTLPWQQLSEFRRLPTWLKNTKSNINLSINEKLERRSFRLLIIPKKGFSRRAAGPKGPPVPRPTPPDGSMSALMFKSKPKGPWLRSRDQNQPLNRHLGQLAN